MAGRLRGKAGRGRSGSQVPGRGGGRGASVGAGGAGEVPLSAVSTVGRGRYDRKAHLPREIVTRGETCTPHRQCGACAANASSTTASASGALTAPGPDRETWAVYWRRKCNTVSLLWSGEILRTDQGSVAKRPGRQWGVPPADVPHVPSTSHGVRRCSQEHTAVDSCVAHNGNCTCAANLIAAQLLC
jgi:hypothetical protein